MTRSTTHWCFPACWPRRWTARGQRQVWLPVRPVTRRRWPNGRITHEELKPLKALAARMPCPYLNPGRYIGGRPMVQGMRVALSSEVVRTHEELVERILHAGLAYSESVDPETSMVICNEASPTQGKGYAAREIGVPVVSDGEFMDSVSHVIGGTGVEEFTDATADGRAVRVVLTTPGLRPPARPDRQAGRSGRMTSN